MLPILPRDGLRTDIPGWFRNETDMGIRLCCHTWPYLTPTELKMHTVRTDIPPSYLILPAIIAPPSASPDHAAYLSQLTYHTYPAQAHVKAAYGSLSSSLPIPSHPHPHTLSTCLKRRCDGGMSPTKRH